MKKCMAGMFCTCEGQSTITKHYEQYSGKEHTYPDRFWGVVAICEDNKKKEESQGYIFVEVETQQTYML